LNPRPDLGQSRQPAVGDAMPSLFRFFVVLVVLAATAGGAMVYLATFVAPNTREMTVRIPADRLGQ
jgi:SNF family Na+-dependent transporter